MRTAVARWYSTVFTPEVFVLLCGLLVVGYEWRRRPSRPRRGLGVRLAAFTGGWLLGVVVYLGVDALAGPRPVWTQDAAGSVGLVVGLGAVWLAWDRLDWGPLVRPFAAILVAVSLPHLLITPFWDVSTHVLYAVVPAGTLVLIDRRFVPLGIVALGMVVARPLAGAHSWPQSVGGLALGLVALVVVARWLDREQSASVDEDRRAAVPVGDP